MDPAAGPPTHKTRSGPPYHPLRRCSDASDGPDRPENHIVADDPGPCTGRLAPHPKCFPISLQLFVPFAQKNARLGGSANQGAIAIQNPGNEGLTMKLVVAIIKPFKLDEVRQ